jgi:hypothetical protein
VLRTFRFGLSRYNGYVPEREERISRPLKLGWVVLPQVLLLVVFASLLDGGVMLKGYIVSLLAYWCAAAVLLLRTGGSPAKWERRFITWGWIPVIVIGGLAWSTA